MSEKGEIQVYLLDRDTEDLIDKLCQDIRDLCQVAVDYGLK